MSIPLANRATMPREFLGEFRQYLTSNGWRSQALTSKWEVLRMDHEGYGVMIIYQKAGKNHRETLTLPPIAAEWYGDWYAHAVGQDDEP